LDLSLVPLLAVEGCRYRCSSPDFSASGCWRRISCTGGSCDRRSACTFHLF